MAYSRRRLSKRQKRRSLKRNNVKSRKVMRGGSRCKSGWTRAQQEGNTAKENWLKANGIQQWSPTMCEGKP
jgi:hypothetical protein